MADENKTVIPAIPGLWAVRYRNVHETQPVDVRAVVAWRVTDDATLRAMVIDGAEAKDLGDLVPPSYGHVVEVGHESQGWVRSARDEFEKLCAKD